MRINEEKNDYASSHKTNHTVELKPAQLSDSVFGLIGPVGP